MFVTGGHHWQVTRYARRVCDDWQIFIEARDIAFFGLPWARRISTLFFRDSDDKECAIRSGPERASLPLFGDMKGETNMPIDASANDRDGNAPAERASTPLDFSGLTDNHGPGRSWSSMPA